MGRGLIVGYQDVVFMPAHISLSTTFHGYCGRDDSLETTTFLNSVVGRKLGHAPCRILLRHTAFSCVSRIQWRS